MTTHPSIFYTFQSLALLNRKWSWEAVLNAVKAAFPKQYVRTTEAVDKDALNALRHRIDALRNP